MTDQIDQLGIDRLREENADLREQLARGLVVPMETLKRWLPTMEAGANCNRSSDDAELRAMLSAAKEKKNV